jgi:histidine triad (HIT) family protein
MSEEGCFFCKIINREIPATIVSENSDVIVIKDIAPKAPIHYLIIPKKHIADVNALTESYANYVMSMMFMAQKIAKTMSGTQSFRLLINNGSGAGQSIFHLHAHFLAGKMLTGF